MLIGMLSLVISRNIIEYRFGYNLGTVFYDFSLNGYHGKNSFPESIIPTDRGIFLTQNSQAWVEGSFSKTFEILPDSYSIILWTNVIECFGGLVFLHIQDYSFFIMIDYSLSVIVNLAYLGVNKNLISDSTIIQCI